MPIGANKWDVEIYKNKLENMFCPADLKTYGILFSYFFSGIAVGLYHEYGHEEISRVALECKADIIVVENEALLKKVLLIQHKLPDLRAIVQLQGDPPLSDKRRLHKSHKVCKNLQR
jgi:long-subunit acyl-CoA synthetase (AMP-forming)